jgi:hypothetical protein
MLIAHEVIHAVQQRGAPTSGQLSVSAPGDTAEVEAEAMASTLQAESSAQPPREPAGPAGHVRAHTAHTAGAGLAAGAAAFSIARVVDPASDGGGDSGQPAQAPDGGVGATGTKEGLTQSADAAVQAVKAAPDTALGVRIGIDAVIASLLDPAPSQNPAPLEADKGADVKAVPGTAFGPSPAVSPADVSQGQLGDCYLLSMIIAIARIRPDVLQNLIKDNGDGTYDVTLYEGHIFKGATPYTEKVTAEVPVDKSGNPLYAQVNPRKDGGRPLWPLLIEKAYAKHKGGYSDIVGGEGTDAAQALSQKGGVRRSTSDFDTATIAEKIDIGLSKGMALTASSIQRPIDKMRDWLKNQTGMSSTDVSEAEKKWNIKAPHEYIVKSVDKTALTIDLINPWGHDHLTALPLDVFKVAFHCWTEADLGPAPAAPAASAAPAAPAKP